jgi:hypothetical protein
MSTALFLDTLKNHAENDMETALNLPAAEAIAAANPHIIDPAKKHMPLTNPEVPQALLALLKQYDINIDALKKAGLILGEGEKSMRLGAKAYMEYLDGCGMGIYAKNFIGEHAPAETLRELLAVGAVEEKKDIDPKRPEYTYNLVKICAFDQKTRETERQL